MKIFDLSSWFKGLIELLFWVNFSFGTACNCCIFRWCSRSDYISHPVWCLYSELFSINCTDFSRGPVNTKNNKTKVLASVFASFPFKIFDIHNNVQQNFFLRVIHGISIISALSSIENLLDFCSFFDNGDYMWNLIFFKNSNTSIE